MQFIALAILTNIDILDLISNRRLNLQSFVRSFEENKNIDILLNFHEVIKQKRLYTLESLDMGITKRLFSLDSETCKVYPIKDHFLGKIKGLNKNMKGYGNKAEILGKWFSQHDLQTISTYFKVIF